MYVFVLSPSTELCDVVVCCCHCWFMRQLWRRISLLSLRQGFVVLLFLSSTYISAENTNQRLCHLIDIKDNHHKTTKEMINALLIKFDWIRMFCSYTNNIFFLPNKLGANSYPTFFMNYIFNKIATVYDPHNWFIILSLYKLFSFLLHAIFMQNKVDEITSLGWVSNTREIYGFYTRASRRIWFSLCVRSCHAIVCLWRVGCW